MRRRASAGLYLVVLTALVVFLIGAAALVLGLGYLSTARAHLQNVASLTSLAAVESFSSAPAGSDFPTRLLAAQSRANAILAANAGLPGLAGGLPSLSLSPSSTSSGFLEAGNWYPEQISDPACPTPASAGCCPVYPCFRPIDASAAPTNQSSNASRVTLRLAPSNPLVVPMATVLGQSGKFSLQTSAITAATQKCFVALLDISYSTIAETHADYGIPWIQNGAQPGDNPGGAPDPPNPLQIRVARRNPGAGPPDEVPTIAMIYPAPDWARAQDSSTARLPGYSAFFTTQAFGSAALPKNFTTRTESDPWACSSQPIRVAGGLNPVWGGPLGQAAQMWCSMEPSRQDFSPRPRPSPFTDQRLQDPRYHFRSDYSYIRVPAWGNAFYLIDTYVNGPGYAGSNPAFPDYSGPQPYTGLMLSFNVGVQYVNNLKSPGDKGAIMVFAGKVLDSEPQFGRPELLSTDLSYLGRLTNFDNRGVKNWALGNARPDIPFSDRTPNAVQRGWLPISSTDPGLSSTNVIDALNQAIGRLASCPDTAQKVILLATDGIVTCKPPGSGGVDPTVDCVSPNPFQNYLLARDYILTTLRQQLISNRISVTTLLDSSAVNPSFDRALGASAAAAMLGTGCAETIPPSGSDPGKQCQSANRVFNQAPRIPGVTDAASGPDELDLRPDYDIWRQFTLPPGDGCRSLGTPSTFCQNRFAISRIGSPGVRFRDPMGWTQQLAKETDGVICVIQPKCTLADCADPTGITSPYDSTGALRPQCRASSGFQSCATSDNSKTEQALSCVLAALGSVPFQPVEPPPGGSL